MPNPVQKGSFLSKKIKNKGGRDSKWTHRSKKIRKVWKYWCWKINKKAAYCMRCGISELTSIKLTADHLGTWQNKDTRYDIDQLQVLCGNCNVSKHGKPDYRPKEFITWLETTNDLEDICRELSWKQWQYEEFIGEQRKIYGRI